MGACPKKGDVSDLCPLGVCQGYGKESIAGGSRLLDRCTMMDSFCDAHLRDWDGPLFPFCWRFQAAGREAAEALVKVLVEAVEAARWYQIGSGPCHHEADGGGAECESCKLLEKCEAALAAVKGRENSDICSPKCADNVTRSE